MATLDYISVPSSASRLQTQQLEQDSAESRDANDIRPAPKLRTSLPRPSTDHEGPTSPSIKGFGASSAFNLLPHMLLSSSLPAGSIPNSESSNPNDTNSNPARKRTKSHQEPIVLLSNRDPLSIQITTVNFKRFIERVGPVFWLQDRVEEIMFWRRGWKVTGTWLSVYGLLCYFPRLVFLLPHITLVAVILATVRYPAYRPPPPAATFSGSTSTPPSMESLSTSETPLPAPIAEESVDWQANIQAIQNLMGLYADCHAAITPYLVHLSLSQNTPQLSKPTKSPYTLPLLTVLLLTLPGSIFLVTSPLFPARLACFVCGAGPVMALNPELRLWCAVVMGWLTSVNLPLPMPTVSAHLPNSVIVPIPSPIRYLSSRIFGLDLSSQLEIDPSSLALFRKRAKMRLQRLIDDNNLTDEVWNSEMREVELWENERLDPGTILPPASSTMSPSNTRVVSPPPHPPPPYSARASLDESGTSTEKKPQTSSQKPPHQRSRSTFFGSATSGNGGWSKSHLKSNERLAWTRSRDGWSGVGGSGNEGDGTVSSNLTFSLAPDWEFVETEGWRADLVGVWVRDNGLGDEVVSVGQGLSADENGWVYSNDVWLMPADHQYPGAVTRRRRWVRRIWYRSTVSKVE